MRLALLVILGLGLAPGCTHNDRASTIHTSVVGLDAARDGVVAYDHVEQTSIVNGATSAADANAKLATYRAARGKVSDAIATGYRELAIAAGLNDAPSLNAAIAAVQAAVNAAKALTGGSL